MHVTVNEVVSNRPPTATNDALITDQDSSASVDVLANDIHADQVVAERGLVPFKTEALQPGGDVHDVLEWPSGEQREAWRRAKTCKLADPFRSAKRLWWPRRERGRKRRGESRRDTSANGPKPRLVIATSTSSSI